MTQHPVSWVVLSLMLAISPHLERFPGWALILVPGLFAWRLLCIRHEAWLPPKWLLIVVILLASVGTFIHFGTLFGKTAGSVILSILLAVKLHESTTRRDYMLLMSLSFFIIVTNFLFSQSIPTVVFMLLLVIVLVMSMITINQGNTQLSIKHKLRLATRLTLQALPLMLVMFILFPRVSGPLWQLPEEKQSAITGLSDTMTPGNISRLIQSNALAFRVEFEDELPEHHQLYWRGLVLWYFDGQTWQQGKRNITPRPVLRASPPAVGYTVTLEPHFQHWLYGLDIPTEVKPGIHYSSDFLLRSKDRVTSLLQYRLSSSLDYVIQPSISPWERSAGLKIPPNSNPRALALGRQLAQQYNHPVDIVQRVLGMYRQQDFHYTLTPPATPGFDPVDQFFFDTRKGFCEHYASSFTFIMRAAGVPARVVLGYQGGTVNPLNRVITVRQKDAHAWAEVWIENQGWIRIDPTASIAPQRVETSLDAALSPQEARPLHMQINTGLIKDLLFYWDALDNQWKQWVIGYNSRLQHQFLESLFNQRLVFSDLFLLMFAGFSLVLAGLAMAVIKPWQRPPQDPVVRIYHQFCNKLARAGIQRLPHEGPLDFAERAGRRLPAQQNSIMLITRLYTRLRYEANPQEKQLQQFRRLAGKFRPATTGRLSKG